MLKLVLSAALISDLVWASPAESTTQFWDGLDQSQQFEYDDDVNAKSLDDDGRPKPPPDYKSGPMPTISDSLFSLIILLYVSIIFIFMFFSFCWKEPQPPPPDPALKNIPMITDILAEMEAQERERKEEQRLLENGGTNGDITTANATELSEIGRENEEGDSASAAQPQQQQDGNKILVNVITEKLSPSSPLPPMKEEEETTTDTPV